MKLLNLADDEALLVHSQVMRSRDEEGVGHKLADVDSIGRGNEQYTYDGDQEDQRGDEVEAAEPGIGEERKRGDGITVEQKGRSIHYSRTAPAPKVIAMRLLATINDQGALPTLPPRT